MSETSTRWFGYKPFAPICADTPRVATPVGQICAWCNEPILPDEDGFVLPMMHTCGHVDDRPWHLNCHMRSLIGGVNHLRRVCGCFGGALASDPAGMTAREAADAAVQLFHQQRT
jgi:hypothetical protein